MTEKSTLCMTVDELGQQLGVSRPVAYELAHRDGFPSIKLGRRLLIPRAALEQWLQDNAGKTLN